jgi:hypothetical protein
MAKDGDGKMVSHRAEDKKTLISIILNGFHLEANVNQSLPLILSQKGILDIGDVLNMSFDETSKT